jgi:WD40 repeat protein
VCIYSDGTIGGESLVVSESSRLMILSVMSISDSELLRVITIKDDVIYALESLSTTTRDVSDSNLLLASGLGSGEIEIWDVRNGQLVNSFKAHASPVNLMARLSDGSLVTTSGDENSVIKIWK